MIGQFIVPILIALALLVIVRCIRIVPQAQAYVVTRLGAYKTTWDVGLHMKVPFLEQIAKRMLDDCLTRILRAGFSLRLAPESAAFLAQFGRSGGARGIRSAIRSRIEAPCAQLLLSGATGARFVPAGDGMEILEE